MYIVKNGVLYKDGVAKVAIGQSYYASYHKQKVPVLETGDRIGEMKKDLKAMREAGFNIVRYAALGDMKYEGDKVKVDFPFIDAMIDEASRDDMATCIRLQGYSINLAGHENTTMLNQMGEEMPFRWSWFVRNCMNHAGIVQDNEKATLVSAEHFGKFKDMVSFQIYNEAAYPKREYYDYHPETIKAYRKWLVQKGIMSEDDAKDYQPPKRRPYYDENPLEWANFRLFNTEVMSGFLNHLSLVAKDGYKPAETVTCHMTYPYSYGSAMLGQDYFDIACVMDIVGITHYFPSYKTDFFRASMALDGAESAAAVYGKNAWLIEYNARTDCPLAEYERETYNAVGSAFKGIFYYQWRADYPFEDGPEPNGFGMIFNDGTKSEKFDGAVKMNKLVDKLSPYIATAGKLRSGVAILYSKHANAYYDAIDNGARTDVYSCVDRNITYLRNIYIELKRMGIVADFVRAEDLEKNPLKTKVLFVPSMEGLSQVETQQIDEFAKDHPVFDYCAGHSGYRININCKQFIEKYKFDPPDAQKGVGKAEPFYNLKPILSVLGVKPLAKVDCENESVYCGILAGKGYYTVALTNADDFLRPVTDGVLTLSKTVASKVSKVTFITPSTKKALKLEGNKIKLPQITTGAFVILEK